jgi:hypothetical protein
MALLESLFVFLMQEREVELDSDINKEIQTLLVSAEESLEVIREFNKQVPLTRILRCVGVNRVAPQEISGGEDWFMVYRDYWKRHVEEKAANFTKERHKQELLNSSYYFLKGINIKPLDSVATESNPEGFPLKGAFGLSFLRTFFSSVFMTEINETLEKILMSGEFSTKENRMEFGENYNKLVQMQSRINKFASDITRAGDYGNRFAPAKQGISSLSVKRRKIQAVVDEASAESIRMIEEARQSCGIVFNILEGILGRDTKGKYYTLLNMEEIADKAGDFIDSLNNASDKFQKTIAILDDIDTMEAGR